VDGLNSIVQTALGLEYETDLFREELELEKLSLEWVNLLLPAWSRAYPTIDDQLMAATVTALRWSWGAEANVNVDLEKAELVLQHPAGFEERKFIAF
jgi:hypothetical protein